MTFSDMAVPLGIKIFAIFCSSLTRGMPNLFVLKSFSGVLTPEVFILTGLFFWFKLDFRHKNFQMHGRRGRLHGNYFSYVEGKTYVND